MSTVQENSVQGKFEYCMLFVIVFLVGSFGFLSALCDNLIISSVCLLLLIFVFIVEEQRQTVQLLLCRIDVEGETNEKR